MARLAKQNWLRKLARLRPTRLVSEGNNDLPSLNLRGATDSFLKFAKKLDRRGASGRLRPFEGDTGKCLQV
jgi:hypothetical protein